MQTLQVTGARTSIEVLVNTGEITLQLPENTGVHVEAAMPVAVEAAGFRQMEMLTSMTHTESQK